MEPYPPNIRYTAAGQAGSAGLGTVCKTFPRNSLRDFIIEPVCLPADSKTQNRTHIRGEKITNFAALRGAMGCANPVSRKGISSPSFFGYSTPHSAGACRYKLPGGTMTSISPEDARRRRQRLAVCSACKQPLFHAQDMLLVRAAEPSCAPAGTTAKKLHKIPEVVGLLATPKTKVFRTLAPLSQLCGSLALQHKLLANCIGST